MLLDDRLRYVFLSYAVHFHLDTEPGTEPTDENIAAALDRCARRPEPEWYEPIRDFVHEYRRNPAIVQRIERDGRSGALILREEIGA